MEDSILNSTKKILGIMPDYTSFDIDIITHINGALAIINQIGIGPVNGFMIEDNGAQWEDLALPMNQMNLLRTYVFLKVRLLFDPPTSGFTLTAMDKQIQEYETRLSYMREATLPTPVKGVNTYANDMGYEDGYRTGMLDAIQDLTGS